MYVANSARASNASVVALLLLAVVLASCGGDGGSPTVPEGAVPPACPRHRHQMRSRPGP